MPVPTLITELSATIASNSPPGSESPASLDDYQRAHAGFIAQLHANTVAAATVIVASATSTAIGAAASENVDISGTTTITGFGTIAEGINRKGRFTGVLILTHNATSLILPGNANITTAANDRYEARSLGAGNWIVTKYVYANGSVITAVTAVTATTATTLATARNISGVAFNGSANIILHGTPQYDAPTAQTTNVSVGVADLNLQIQAGDYNFDVGSTNKPAGITQWGFLHVFRHVNTASGAVYVHQTACDMNGSNPGIMYTRQGTPAAGYTCTWSPWRLVMTHNIVFGQSTVSYPMTSGVTYTNTSNGPWFWGATMAGGATDTFYIGGYTSVSKVSGASATLFSGYVIPPGVTFAFTGTALAFSEMSQ